jgi:ribosomal-protein-alanine N-acetyltransferase
VSELQLLRRDHAQAVLSFETQNRAYFAGFISDRGDEYFEHFDEVHARRLAEQESGEGAYYVLADDDGSVLGRFNLLIDGDAAEVGYRVAERAAGRGVATAAVQQLCRLASDQHSLRTLKAATSLGNTASQRVLLKAGFVEAGPADPEDVGGKPGTWYQLDLGG